MAQNFLAQQVDGIYMFNYPCLLFEQQKTKEDFAQLAAVLRQIGAPETLKNTAKQFTFWQHLPITVESSRPPQYHQTIAFHINDPSVENNDTKVTLRFIQAAERNPHAKGQFEQDPVIGPDWITYILNGRDIEARYISSVKQPVRMLQSGFTLTDHELVEITPPPRMIVNGENSLAFHVRRFPDERDPYVNIYELTVDVAP